MRESLLLLTLVLWIPGPGPLSAQAPADVGDVGDVDLERLERGAVRLDGWLYRADADIGDEPPPGVTQQWSRQASVLRSGGTPEDWTGSGWFAIRFGIESDLVGRPLALRFERHYGASRIFLDGELLAVIGRPSLDPAELVATTARRPIFFEVENAGRHELAVHFVNPELERYHRVGYPAGFVLTLDTADGAAASYAAWDRRYAGRRGLFTGIFLSFALLHLLLFAFRPQGRENLDFAVICAALATLVFLLAHKGVADEPRIVFWSEGAMNAAALLFALFGVLFVHRVFSGGAPRWLPSRARTWAGLFFVAVLGWAVLRPGAAIPVVFFAMLAALIEMARCVIHAQLRRIPGAGIVGAGIVTLVVGFGAGVLANMGVLPSVPVLTFVVPFASVLALIVSMSVYLSRRYALTQRELEHQIEQVRQLSEDKLREERRLREQMIQNELLEAEVARKAEELEDARRLQLSMLPQTIPEHSEIELAAHMTTATEVGGDYYDFDVAEDGTLTLAIGDATGHGMRAGTMVTATKSLFNALAGDRDMLETVNRSNLALKRMNLRNLNMAFLLARFHDGRLRVSAAGMPPPLIHRAGSNEVITLEVGGMPLGSVRSFPYRSVDVELDSGDTVLLMSDGFPERGNADGEQLGYDRALDLFAAVARQPSQAVVDALVAAGDEWAAGAELDDDVTFVVMSVR